MNCLLDIRHDSPFDLVIAPCRPISDRDRARHDVDADVLDAFPRSDLCRQAMGNVPIRPDLGYPEPKTALHSMKDPHRCDTGGGVRWSVGGGPFERHSDGETFDALDVAQQRLEELPHRRESRTTVELLEPSGTVD